MSRIILKDGRCIDFWTNVSTVNVQESHIMLVRFMVKRSFLINFQTRPQNLTMTLQHNIIWRISTLGSGIFYIFYLLIFSWFCFAVWQNASKEIASDSSLTPQALQVHGAGSPLHKAILPRCIPAGAETNEHSKSNVLHHSVSPTIVYHSLYMVDGAPLVFDVSQIAPLFFNVIQL